MSFRSAKHFFPYKFFNLIITFYFVKSSGRFLSEDVNQPMLFTSLFYSCCCFFFYKFVEWKRRREGSDLFPMLLLLHVSSWPKCWCETTSSWDIWEEAYVGSQHTALSWTSTEHSRHFKITKLQNCFYDQWKCNISFKSRDGRVFISLLRKTPAAVALSVRGKIIPSLNMFSV